MYTKGGTTVKKWLITITAIVVGCVVALWYFQERYVKEEPLSQKEAIDHIETLYNGKVKYIEKQGHQYEMELLRNGSTYEVVIDVNTRQVQDLQLKKAATKRRLSEAEIRKYVMEYASGNIESVLVEDRYYKVIIENEHKIKNLTMDAYTGVILSEEDTLKDVNMPMEEETVISEQKAIQIALQELKGDIDSVDYKETADGGYYEIEIESENDEVTILIHGVTGEVMSVEWDEDD